MKTTSGEYANPAEASPASEQQCGAEAARTEIGRMAVSGVEGKEIVVQIVEAPPGAVSERHFHYGKEFFYILEGAGLEPFGKPPQKRPTGGHGVNLHEAPHAGYRIVGDKTLRMIAFYVIDKGEPLQVPAPHDSADARTCGDPADRAVARAAPNL